MAHASGCGRSSCRGSPTRPGSCSTSTIIRRAHRSGTGSSNRLFCHITQTWRGRPLTDRMAVVELIAATTTKAGLKIESALDTRAPMRPPAPRLLCRACGKCIRVGRTRRPSLERRFGISGSCRCRATLPIAGAFGKLVDQLLVHEHPIGHAELAAQAVLQVRHRQFAHRRPLPESRRCALVKRDVTSDYSSWV